MTGETYSTVYVLVTYTADSRSIDGAGQITMPALQDSTVLTDA